MNHFNNTTVENIFENVVSIIESNFYNISDDVTVRLISTGLLDSLKVMILISKIEEYYKINIEAHEIDSMYMDTIEQLSLLIFSKINNEKNK